MCIRDRFHTDTSVRGTYTTSVHGTHRHNINKSDQSNDADKSAPPPAQPSEEGRSITVGNTVVKVVGAGVGKDKQTSGVWKYVMDFEPPVKNKNIKCFVKRKLPASGEFAAVPIPVPVPILIPVPVPIPRM